jgi:hypothetical protein
MGTREGTEVDVVSRIFVVGVIVLRAWFPSGVRHVFVARK